jgi:hypothetical protein
MVIGAALLQVVMLRPSAAQTVLPAPGAEPENFAPVPSQPTFMYVRPTPKTRLKNLGLDAIGPYPLAGSALAAGINQSTNTVPEWLQSFAGYSRRFGSDFGVAAIGTTTRYGLSELFREDSLYYRCRCSGFGPRLNHAVLSTFTARRGEDGHTVFSIPSLIAPYAGTMGAVYGWYPERYGAQDAFRMGHYALLALVGSNIVLEFVYAGPHSLFSRVHLNNHRAAPDPGPGH